MRGKEQTDYYSVLGLRPEAKDSEVRKSYRELALRYHPDRNPEDRNAEEKFKELSQAYHILGDSQKRREYDLWQMSRRESFHRDGLRTEEYWSLRNDPFIVFSDAFGRKTFRRACRGRGRCGRRRFTSYDKD